MAKGVQSATSVAMQLAWLIEWQNGYPSFQEEMAGVKETWWEDVVMLD